MSKWIALFVVGVMLSACPVGAEMEEVPSPVESIKEPSGFDGLFNLDNMLPEGWRWSAQGGVEMTTAYFNRGFVQEDQGVIFQPHVEAGVRVGNIEVFAGTWNSFHTEPEDEWFENDMYIGGRLYIGEHLTLTGQYTWYSSFEDYVPELEDMRLTLAAYDDKLANGISLNPYGTIYIETDGALDGIGDGEGMLLVFGIQPNLPLVDTEQGQVHVRVPVEVGISLDDYYEIRPSSGLVTRNEDFGYVDLGAEVVLTNGNKEVFVGAHYIWLGDNNLADNGDQNDIYGVCGFRIGFSGPE